MESFGKTISYKSGAYLIIEHTEALHVVDVNSGNRSKSGNGQEANALDVNLGAADELARQLRLRDMGGIIVVDFIDMNLAENRQKLYERMCVRPWMSLQMKPVPPASGKVASNHPFFLQIHWRVKLITWSIS